MPGFRIAAGEARKLIGELAPPQASSFANQAWRKPFGQVPQM